METRAYLKGTRLSAQKAGLVADVVRGKSVHAAMDFLTFHKQKASAVIKKLLESAIANAENNDKADIDLLVVKSVIVNQGMRLKRMKPRARGRADRIPSLPVHVCVNSTFSRSGNTILTCLDKIDALSFRSRSVLRSLRPPQSIRPSGVSLK